MESPAPAGGPPPAAARDLPERQILLLVAAVQFVNVLDFMIVMPLAPDFARALGIPADRLGLLAGAYTAAAATAGIAGSFFLDRFDRRSALAVALLGLVAGTAAGGVARGLGSLLLARVLAGLFGGPATSIALSIVADTVPPARRGRAMGIVMSGFAAASVLGVPAGLELARRAGWQAPFFAVAGLGAAVAAGVVRLLPPMGRHRAASGPPAGPGLGTLLRLAGVRSALLASAVSVAAMFLVIPNLSAWIQLNAGYPRARLGVLYLAGGLASFALMRAIGALADRFGSPAVAAGGTFLFAAVLGSEFLLPRPLLSPAVFFVLFMLSNTLRMIPLQALASRVPRPAERARFLSIQSAVQHGSLAAAAVLSSAMLRTLPDGRLGGMATVAALSMAAGIALPILLAIAATALRGRGEEVPARLADAGPGIG